MASNRLTELANAISENTKIITDYLASKNLSAPSLDADGLVELPISPADKDAWTARSKLVAATKELQVLTVGPKESLRHLAWDCVNNLSLRAIYHFDIAKAVPLSGDISHSDLAKITKVDPTNLRRLIRHAITNFIFREPRPGYVAHTSSSRLLAEDAQLQAWVGFFSEDLQGPVAKTVDAMDKWPESQEPRNTGFQVANNTEDNFFEWFAKNPDRLGRYGTAMAANAASEGYNVKHVVEGYAWDSLGEAIVVDLGGSQGHVSVAIAEKYPNLKFVVQELPSMRPPYVTGTLVTPQLESRVTLTTHDFFTPQPVTADIYYFRWIFHNWSDSYAIKILQSLVPALKPGARVLINDGILPEPGTVGGMEEKSIRTMDLLQFVTCNGREREVQDWKDLFRQADERFQFSKAWKPEKSHMWLIEAAWTP
ncbi:related to sterigmatocystin 7-O-methyltransferase precursor [Phialocephala subalpina]|uniref:Related to sterigmatocystin 7-O-methyltransferase n=1 Tax=Phialocephala subalpina TaxID=576137 RepID=A0A1L7XGU4_9HELO|nr:related to sterigmatocystin 7-O-methyltransferase precursor [Phialocephala subalpina]